MKRFIRVTSVFALVPLFAMQKDNEASSDLKNIPWSLHSVAGNEKGSSCLRTFKVQQGEQDIEWEHLTFGIKVNERCFGFYETPLQAAVKQADVHSVKKLCAAGADRHVKIKCSEFKTVNELDAAAKEAHCDWIEYFPTPDQEERFIVKKVGNSLTGISALDLAEKLLMQTTSGSELLARRKAIYDLLTLQQ